MAQRDRSLTLGKSNGHCIEYLAVTFKTQIWISLHYYTTMYPSYPSRPHWPPVCSYKLIIMYWNYTSHLSVNPKKTGGGGLKGPPPPSTFRAITLQRAKLSSRHFMTFSFKFPTHFDTKFVTPGGTVLKLRNFLYMHVGPKMAPKCDFVYKINANWFFSHSSYQYAYIYSQWLKWICFSIIVLQKVSATNFTEKTNKNKRSKKQRNT